MYIEGCFDRIPPADEQWGHEWDFPLYSSPPLLVLPSGRFPAFDKHIIWPVIVKKRHTLRHFDTYEAIDTSNMASALRDQALELHQPPPHRVLVPSYGSVVLTADVGALKKNTTVTITGMCRDALICCGPTGEEHEVKRIPYTITVSTSHGDTMVSTQTWTREQLPVTCSTDPW